MIYCIFINPSKLLVQFFFQTTLSLFSLIIIILNEIQILKIILTEIQFLKVPVFKCVVIYN